MKETVEFNFGDNSVARAYDTHLVPVLFKPWATKMIEENSSWTGKVVLDLACGTGAVTKELVKSVGPEGKVIALDINREMLDLARTKCNEWENQIEFASGSADNLPISNNSIDIVVCQQGFQFFPDKKGSADEIFRVLKPKGKAIISTWCNVSECIFFGLVCETLESLNLIEISQMMRVPFDLLTKEELKESFIDAGFSDSQISKQEQKLFLEGGEAGALNFVYATPIGPKLKALEEKMQEEFKNLLIEKMQELRQSDGSLGKMVTHILKLEK